MSARIENEYLPKSVTHPGATLAEALEERGMSQAQLSERAGRPKKTINEIIKGQAAITPETAIQLERVLGIPASFWNNRQRHYDESVARIQADEKLRSQSDWLGNFPISQMIRLGWIEKKSSKVLQLESLLSFFGISSPDEWETVCRAPWLNAAFRSSKSFETNQFALSAWLRKGEIEAASVECKPFEKTAFRDSLREMRRLVRSARKGFDVELRLQCASAGVAFVLVPLMAGVHAWGATRWLSPDKAMILMSLRGKMEDIFWFTFFHESAHIFLHGKRESFVEGLEHSSETEEKEADSFASETLISSAEWRDFVADRAQFSEDGVTSFARKMDVSPAVVVGRLHHEKHIPSSALNGLRRRIDALLSE
jgi:HTH-type transcriptional regulator / antitoxin HigA